jgi:hypothetical protein
MNNEPGVALMHRGEGRRLNVGVPHCKLRSHSVGKENNLAAMQLKVYKIN